MVAGALATSASGHAGQLAAVLDALDAGVPPPVTPAETRQTLEFIAALYASAFTGKPCTADRSAPTALSPRACTARRPVGRR